MKQQCKIIEIFMEYRSRTKVHALLQKYYDIYGEPKEDNLQKFSKGFQYGKITSYIL